MHRSKLHHHSTTSSATSRNSRLIVSPKSLAAFRLITSSNLIGCSTGNSAGLLGHQLWAKKGRPRFPELVRFVLNKYDEHVPCGLRVFGYLLDPTGSRGFRQSGMSGVVNFNRGKQHVFSEIAFSPFGFLLTGDIEPIHADLCDITHLADHPFHRKETWWLKLPILPVVSWLPGDFRTADEIQKNNG